MLGRGGMGEVYEGFDFKARRPVALKFVAPELATDPTVFKRFETEAVSAAAMNHPHIATLYEFEPEGERPFIAMELVKGPSLRTRLHGGPLPVAEALDVARDVAAALAYAHRRNIIHRDIKPENLMFDEEGRVKVMDFGLARALLASRLTMTGNSLGTPAYMAPESVLHGAAGPPADVFALGVVLVEMVSGRQPFQGESPLAVLFAIANTDAPPLRTLCPDAPEAVERLAARLLARDAGQRPDAAAAARELAALTGTRVSQLALDPAEAGSSGTLSGGGAPDTRTGAATAAIPSRGATAPMTPVPGRRSSAGLVVGIALVVIAAAAGFAWWSRAQTAQRARHQQAVVLNDQAYDALKNADLATARQKVEQALALDPSFGAAQLNRARIVQTAGNADSAAVLYQDVVRNQGKYQRLTAMAYYNLGDLALESHAYGQAADDLRKSFEADSSGWQVYNNYGYALAQAARPAEALAVLERGIARFPGASALYKNSALALMALGRDADARARADRALAIDPKATTARGLRARLRARLGDRAGALDDWRLYAAADPPPDATERDAVARELADHGVAVATK